MANIEQLPGELNILTTIKDDLSILLDFDVVLTGYTFTAYVNTATPTAITVTNTDLAAGKITLSMTDTTLTTIGAGAYTWYLKWNTGTSDRCVLSGNFILTNQ